MLLQVSKVKVFKALGRSRVMDNTLWCCSTDRDEEEEAATDED
jgi:hypothetical protein